MRIVADNNHLVCVIASEAKQSPDLKGIATPAAQRGGLAMTS
jgi:hypothetical protein